MGTTGTSRPAPAPHEIPHFRAEGIAFLALTLAVGVGGMNTGNNLLYLVLSMMLAFLLVSGILALSTLRHVTATRRLPSRVHAGIPAFGGLVLHNDKRWFGSFALTCRDLTADGSVVMLRFVPHVGAREEVELRVRYLFPRRGLHRLPGLRLGTSFPFGFLERSRRFRAPATVLVYPAVADVDLRGLLPSGGRGEQSASRKGTGDEIHAIRPFVHGDPPRHVAWKHTARASTLMVRDFEAPSVRRGTVRCDLGAALTVERTAEGWDEELERAISQAAGTVSRLLAEGWSVRFETHGLELPHDTGRGQMDRVLDALARLDPYGEPLPPLPAAASPSGDTVLEVRPRAAIRAAQKPGRAA